MSVSDRKVAALWFALLLFGSSAGADSSGVDGAEFITEPVPNSLHCDGVFLKGTSRFRDWAFVLPHPLLSINPKREPIFDLSDLAKDGTADLRFSIYIPSKLEDVQLTRSRDSRFLSNICPMAQVEDYLRKVRKIGYVGVIPAQYITVEVPGLGKYTIGDLDANILATYGIDHSVSFKIPNPAAYNEFRRNFVSSEGVPAKVSFIFSARRSKASITVRVDREKLTDKVLKTLNVSPALGGKLFSLAMVQVAFESSLQRDQGTMQIDWEGEGDGDFSSQARDLVASSLKALIETSQLETPADDPSASKVPMISVRSIVSHINSRFSGELRLDRVGSLELVKYVTDFNLHGSLDPSSFHLHLGSNDSSTERKIGYFIHKGDMLLLHPVSRVYQPLAYDYDEQYLSLEGINSLGKHRLLLDGFADKDIREFDFSGDQKRAGVPVNLLSFLTTRIWNSAWTVWQSFKIQTRVLRPGPEIQHDFELPDLAGPGIRMPGSIDTALVHIDLRRLFGYRRYFDRTGLVFLFTKVGHLPQELAKDPELRFVKMDFTPSELIHESREEFTVTADPNTSLLTLHANQDLGYVWVRNADAHECFSDAGGDPCLTWLERIETDTWDGLNRDWYRVASDWIDRRVFSNRFFGLGTIEVPKLGTLYKSRSVLDVEIRIAPKSASSAPGTFARLDPASGVGLDMRPNSALRPAEAPGSIESLSPIGMGQASRL